jgi:hypothetical protein
MMRAFNVTDAAKGFFGQRSLPGASTVLNSPTNVDPTLINPLGRPARPISPGPIPSLQDPDYIFSGARKNIYFVRPCTGKRLALVQKLPCS